MPNNQRDAAIKRLRRAAEHCIRQARDRTIVTPVHSRHESPLVLLQRAWREFPECEQDEIVPSPEEVLVRCDAYDRQKEEQERIAARGI